MPETTPQTTGPTYSLAIKFLSNERPWSTTYFPVRPIESDDDALQWAVGMRKGMGNDYAVVLLKDGKPMEIANGR